MNILLSYSLLASSKQGGPITSPSDLQFSFQASLNPDFSTGITSTLEVFTGSSSLFQLIGFSLLTLLMGVVTYLGNKQANEELVSNPGMQEKHSVLYLVSQAGWDGFVFFQLLQFALQSSLILVPSALLYMLILIGHFRLLITLWSPRFLDHNATGNINRNKLMRYIISIYFTMLVLTISLFYYFDQLWLLMLMHLNLLF